VVRRSLLLLSNPTRSNPLSCPCEREPSPDAADFIRLNGSACTEFKSGQATFTTEFPCGAIVV